MKRFFCFLMLLYLSLSGCGKQIREPVTFYYVKADYAETMSSPIASEVREAAGHRDDLAYLMALYFMGPSEEDLVSPLPRLTNLYSIQNHGDAIELNISDTSKTLSDSEFTLAGACLTMTCLELTEAETVTIRSGQRSITLSRESISLLDTLTTTPTEESP